jgi:hypothetical protein
MATRRFARDHDLTDNQTGKLAPDYEAEVEAHTARRVKAYERAARALESAVRRHRAALEASQRTQTTRDRRARELAVTRAWELVEERLRELRVIERMMTELPASRDHRGSGRAKHQA